MATVLADRANMEHQGLPKRKPFGSNLLASKLLQAQTAEAIANRNIPKDILYGEQPLAGGVPTENVTGLELSPLDLIGTGVGTKAAALLGKFGAPLAAALGATAIGSKVNRGTRLGELAAMYPSQRGIFAGPTAKTADIGALDRAKQMQSAGIPDEQIWKETGWTFGFPDKKPRFEISDEAAKLKFARVSPEQMKDIHGNWISKDEFLRHHQNTPEAAAIRLRNTMEGATRLTEDTPKLGEVLHHPDLYTAYPELQNVKVVIDNSMPYGSAGFSPKHNLIKLSPDTDEQALLNLLHEPQHAIQNKENFASGGMPNNDLQQFVQQEYDYLASKPSLTPAEREEMMRLKVMSKGQSGKMTAYRYLAGETEPRLTESRHKLTPAERLAQYPVSQFDVPVEQQIVRYGEGRAMSVPELSSLNPTGSVFTGYSPEMRATAPLSKNMVGLHQTAGGNPNEIITIYRGAPKNQKNIVPGDFITDDFNLAKDYAGTGHVIKMNVQKGDILDDLNEPLGGEYIYRPNSGN